MNNSLKHFYAVDFKFTVDAPTCWYTKAFDEDEARDNLYEWIINNPFVRKLYKNTYGIDILADVEKTEVTKINYLKGLWFLVNHISNLFAVYFLAQDSAKEIMEITGNKETMWDQLMNHIFTPKKVFGHPRDYHRSFKSDNKKE